MVDFSKINIDLDEMPGFYLHLFIEAALDGTKTYYARLCSKKGLSSGQHFAVGVTCFSYKVRPHFSLNRDVWILSLGGCSFFVDQGSVEGLKIWFSENVEDSIIKEDRS